MTRHTGGLAVGAISTKSKSASKAILCASLRATTPTCSPAEPINRTSLALICSFIRVVFLLSCFFGAAMGYPS